MPSWSSRALFITETPSAPPYRSYPEHSLRLIGSRSLQCVAGARRQDWAGAEEQLLPVTALLAEDLDPDGDPLNLTDVSALSTNGGPAALIGTSYLAYLPKPDYAGSDLLTYTLSDPYTSVTGAICFHVLAGDDLTNSVLDISNLGGGVMALTATGIPGWPYVVQSVPSLTLPLSWQTLGTNLANSAGWFQFTDTVATNLERYYRVFTAPNPTTWQIYDAELLSLETTGATGPLSVMLRESPSLLSPGVTLIEPSATSHCTISSCFDVFTEISLDQGHSWHPATNGPASLILTGGLPLNQFPSESLPPLTGRYLSPPEQPELYSPGIIHENKRSVVRHGALAILVQRLHA